MSKLTELEQQADREARHGHRALIEKLEARVAELEADKKELFLDALVGQGRSVEVYDIAWNAAIRAAAETADDYAKGWGYPGQRYFSLGAVTEAKAIANAIRAKLRKGGSDDQ